MGNGMSATPTPKSMVWQGGANTYKNRCHTPTPLKGVGWGCGMPHLFSVGWGNNLVPIVGLSFGGDTGRSTVPFSFPKKSGGVQHG